MPDTGDMDFLKSLQDMLGIDQETAEDVLERLDADGMSSLNDAVANEDTARAQQIVASVQTDEKVNPLFRGNIEDDEDAKQAPKTARRVSDNFGFKFGDDVQVEISDPETGEVRREDGTIYLPNGPHDTVGVKIQGKSKMVKRDKLRKLEENVLGMVAMPNLERMQQLAGLPPGMPPAAMQPTPEIAVNDAGATETDSCEAAQHAMQALDVVQAVLPNVRLADLKAIRQRILNLQASMNEGMILGRTRKL
jgi:hypothetical protein